MLSLLRKDFDWWIVFTIIGTLVISGFLVDYRFMNVWIIPDGNLIEDLLLMWSIFAVVAGLVASFRDELGGTRDYARHRPISPARLFWTKSAWSFVMMLIWLVVPLMVSVIWPMSFPQNRILADYGRFWTFAALSTFMLSSYAVGYFTGTAKGPIIVRFLQGGLIAYPLAYLTDGAIHSYEPVSAGLFAVAQIASAGVIIWVAAMNENHARDKDRPTPSLASAMNTVLLVTGLVISSSVWIGALQAETIFELNQEWPLIARRADGTFAPTIVKGTNHQSEYYAIDDNHEMTTVMEEVKEVKSALPTRGSFTSVNRALHSLNRMEAGLGQNWIRISSLQSRAFINHTEGAVYEFMRANVKNIGRQSPRLQICRRNGSTPFGDPSFYPGLHSSSRVLFVEDRLDRTVWWKNSGEPGNFQPIILPNNDKHLIVYSQPKAGDVKNTRRADFDVIAMGKSGQRYKMINDAFELFPLSQEELKKQEERLESDQWICQLVGGSLFSPKIVVKSRASANRLEPRLEAVFEYQFELKTLKERSFAALVIATSMIKPAVLNGINYGFDEAEFGHGMWTYGIFAGQKHTLILTLGIFLSAVLAFGLRRRLLRIGAPTPIANIWSIVTLMGGPLVLILAYALERPRAYTPVKILNENDAPPCLLKSVTTTATSL